MFTLGPRDRETAQVRFVCRHVTGDGQPGKDRVSAAVTRFRILSVPPAREHYGHHDERRITVGAEITFYLAAEIIQSMSGSIGIRLVFFEIIDYGVKRVLPQTGLDLLSAHRGAEGARSEEHTSE